MGTLISVAGIAFIAAGITYLRGPWQGGAIVVGALLMGLGVWIQRRREFDFSESSPDDAERLKDYVPGKIGGDPRPWLEKHGSSVDNHESSGGTEHE